MAGKGGKGLLAAKTTAAKSAEKDKGKKAPVSRSSRAGLQVISRLPLLSLCSLRGGAMDRSGLDTFVSRGCFFCQYVCLV